MEFFTNATVDLLRILSNICGSYGMGIILLTIIVRVLMWPLSVSQQRSMKVMQKVQPKIKMIQERYKDDPQVMQRKLMEFYKENNFNPMSGCFPVLIQMPIFILLYTALMSSQFIDLAGNAKFFFINRLDATIRGTSARSEDGSFQVGNNPRFDLGKKGVVYFNDGSKEEVKVQNSKNTLRNDKFVPGENVKFVLALNAFQVDISENRTIKSAEVEITNTTSRETELVNFERRGDVLKASVPTSQGSEQMNLDVLALVIIFGISMWLATKIMTMTNKNKQQLDPQQESMQKMMGTTMPIFLTVTFFLVPIPAGVLLYLVVSNIFQIGQTFIINKQLDAAEAKEGNAVIDVKPEK